MSAYVALEEFIRGVEDLAEMNERVAKDAEPDVLAAARATAAAGKSPGGDAWAAKQEGGRALTGAAAAIESSAKKSQIKLEIGPPYVFHQWGAGGSSTTRAAERARERTRTRHENSGMRSKFHAPKRQILPEAGDPLPEEMRDAIEASARRVFAKALGGG